MKNEMENKVVIAYGGKSAEHDISIITAITIFQKYRLAGKSIELLYCDKSGKFFIGNGLDDFAVYKNFNSKKFQEVSFLSGSDNLFLKKKNKYIPLFRVDFVVNCFHGGAGEDGKFSAFIEELKIPTSSSIHTALGVAMDKYYTKMFAMAQDVPIIDFFTFSNSEWVADKERVIQQVLQFDFPVVVKPVSQGSSIGVGFSETLEEFVASVNLALKFDRAVLVERAIVHKREFNCCVVKTEEGKLLARVDETLSDKVIITFKDKYLAGINEGKPRKMKTKTSLLGMQNQVRVVGEKISSKQRALLIKYSRQLYQGLDMNGVVRFDFIMDKLEDKFYLGEINAIPGSMGYYFFDDLNLLKVIYDASRVYWKERFEVEFKDAPTIFN